ncbi:hypothetical protein D915_008179 [Fasciola hepatica]|uniref:Uncharacterized protein n=1 Tax=Fasciola hepatica TaxID=6192 RepID=A0A4E0RUZ8_FASHE|nr:hypothetical protein D915_008179 [Fasciola hepatica]
MESSAAGAATIELQQDSRSTSGSGIIHQPLLLRGRNALAGAGNLEDPASSATSMRMSRIQWMEGTVINSCMGRRRVNCCGVYPDIVVERRLSSTLSSSSSPSSSSSSSDNEDTEEIPKAYRCSRHCCGHPIVTFPQTLHDQSDINAQSSQFRTSQYDFRVKESTEKENNRQNATEKINDSEEVTTEF